MVILEIPVGAGLGNQLFMYSLAYAIAKEKEKKILVIAYDCVQERPFILDKMQLDEKYIYKIVKFRRNQTIKRLILRFILCNLPNTKRLYEIKEDPRRKIDIENINNKNVYIYGYFECFEYFNKYKKELTKQYKLKELSKETKSILEKIQKSKSVALHIRRGDFVNVDRCINIKYYLKAIKKFDNSFTFYLCCEDEKIVKHFLKKKNFQIIKNSSNNKDLEDWYCLLNCQYHIIANSTYSWWSAYLSDASQNKRIIIPNKNEYYESEKRQVDGTYENFYNLNDKAYEEVI